MDVFLEIIKNNYVVFIVITIALILALIGYFVDKLTNKDVKIKQKKQKNKVAEREETIELLSGTANQSINDLMNKKNNTN